MKGETKIVLGFVALLAGTSGFILSWGGFEPSGKIKISQIEFATNATIKTPYYYWISHGAYLRQSSFKNGQKIDGFGEGTKSFFGSTGWRSFDTKIAGLPTPLPSMLVTTGKTYYLKLNDRLPLFDFTNNSGDTYRGELSMEHL